MGYSAAELTAMQERGSAWIMRRAIKDNKRYTKVDSISKDPRYKELKKLYPVIDKSWINTFFLQQKKMLDEFSQTKFKEFNRYEGFMAFITNLIREKFGISQKDNWKFSNDPLIEDEDGYFLEIPISSVKTSLFFYFRFILNKFFGGKNHQSFGDGFAISNSKKQIFELLLKPSFSVASIDGYKASLLNRCAKQNKEQLVLIGHPKAFTPFSLKALDTFISKRQNDSIFTTYSNYNE